MVSRVKYLMTDIVRLTVVRINNSLEKRNSVLKVLASIERSKSFHIFQDKNLWIIVLYMMKNMVNECYERYLNVILPVFEGDVEHGDGPDDAAQVQVGEGLAD